MKVGMYGLRAGPSGSVWASSDAGGTGRRDGFNCQQVFGAAELLAILLCGAWQPFCASGGCTPTHPFVNASVCQTTAARSRWLRHGLCFTIVSRYQGCLNHGDARQRGRVQGTPQTNQGTRGQATPRRRPPMQAARTKVSYCFVSLLLKSIGRPSGSCGKLANSLGRPQTGGTGAAGLRPRVPGWLRACRNGPSQSKSCRDLQLSN